MSSFDRMTNESKVKVTFSGTGMYSSFEGSNQAHWGTGAGRRPYFVGRGRGVGGGHFMDFLSLN